MLDTLVHPAPTSGVAFGSQQNKNVGGLRAWINCWSVVLGILTG